MRIKRKLPPASEPTKPAYKKPEMISPGPGIKVIKIPSTYEPKPAPVPKRKTKKEQAKARKAPIRKPRLTYSERKWTEERIRVLIDLYNQGLPYSEIGDQMGINESTASAMVSKLRRLGMITTARFTTSWTEEQDKTVINMYNSGERYADIARAIGKSNSTIQRRIEFLKIVGELGERRDPRCKK